MSRFFSIHTICTRSSDPLHIVTYCIKWVTSSWTYSMLIDFRTWNVERDDPPLLPGRGVPAVAEQLGVPSTMAL